MDNDRFTEAIDDIERGLRHEDPDFGNGFATCNGGTT
jgi:hypothetical protein